MISGVGGEGGHYQVFQHPQAPPGDGDFIKIPGTDDLGRGQQLAGGVEKCVSGEDGLKEDDAHPQQGGGGAAGVRHLFKCCGTGGTALQIEYLCGHLLHGQGPGGVSGPLGKTADRTAPAEDTEQEVEIHIGSDGNPVPISQTFSTRIMC